MATGSFASTGNNPLQTITWKQLYRKPESLRLPFRLTLPDNQGFIFCEKILRLLPRKRFVFAGHWQDQAVIVKLFIEPGRAAIHFARELAGIQQLAESGTPTPRLLFHGHTQRYRIPILVTEHLTNAKDLAAIWQHHLPHENKSRLMQSVAIELATQHVMGILQHDLHFGNLLIKNHRIYSLDGGSIEFFHQPLSCKQSLNHLALFFSQLGTGTQPLQQHLLSLYAESRGWRLKKSDLHYLKKTTQQIFRERLARYQKKIMRNSRFTQCLSRIGTRIWYDRRYETPELLQLLHNPDAIFRQSDTVMLKNGRSATLARISLNDQSLVIKRYNMKNFFHWLRRCLRPTRAVHCWQKAHVLQLAGIATARPVACIEKRFLGLRGRSYFITENVEGESLAECFTHYMPENSRFGLIAKRTLNLLAQLRELRLNHGDLKATNLLIQRDHPVLIDLDSMKPHISTKQDQARFMANWANQPDIAALFQSLNYSNSGTIK